MNWSRLDYHQESIFALVKMEELRYYTFSILNMKTNTFEQQAGNILSVLGNPFRIQLVFALGVQEACVCHLEALLKKRQAYISQHLMALREAGMLETRRDGKFVYYRLSNPEILELIRYAAEIAGVDRSQFPRQRENEVLDKCICPHCDGGSSVSHLENTENLSMANKQI